MEKLIIAPTSETPEINFDGENGMFKISGKSYPENVNTFYNQIFDYIEKYKQKPATTTTVEFFWLYYNTATNKMIMRIIMFLKDASPQYKIKWYFKKGFELIEEKGTEIKEILDINLETIEI